MAAIVYIDSLTEQKTPKQNNIKRNQLQSTSKAKHHTQQAEGSIFKSEVTVFHYTDRP